MKNAYDFKDTVSQAELFGGLSEEALMAILLDPRCEVAEFQQGTQIYADSCFKRALGIVVLGSVKVYRSGASSNVLLNTLSSGNVFGAASLFGKLDSFVSQIIASDKTTVVFIPSELFRELIEKDSDFAIRYITFLSDKIRFLNRRISVFSAGTALGKLAEHLLKCDDRITPNMKQLASSIGIGRASLYRIIDELEGIGAIKKDGHDILILDRQALRSII